MTKKYLVEIGNMYFVRFDEIEAILIVNDIPGTENSAMSFETKKEAQTVADIIGGKVVVVGPTRLDKIINLQEDPTLSEFERDILREKELSIKCNRITKILNDIKSERNGLINEIMSLQRKFNGVLGHKKRGKILNNLLKKGKCEI
ncbi:hypothetical protein NHG29_01420 [Aerococcaceae bacterium NML160702]|nr:hypothetical protein [Aerococcaceae bacterium NML190073]MCW6681525.1 hypothetical protein [Aerococcaceae bacterium NML160702]